MSYDLLYNQATDIIVNHDMMIVDHADHIAYDKKIIITEGSTLRYCLIGDGARVSLDIQHNGPSAHSSISAICLAQADTSDVYKIWSTLSEAETYSDMTLNTLLFAHSKASVDAMITIKAGADKANGHLHERNIILGHPVNICSLPQLDIHHHNVSAGHGASIDTINDHSLFYMRSKGIDKQEATKLMLSGIVEDAFVGYSQDDVLKKLKKDLLDRIIGLL